MSERIDNHSTEYGFKFGAATVERMFSHRGRVCVAVTTDTGQRVEIYVSPTGRSLRVFRGRKEMQ